MQDFVGGGGGTLDYPLGFYGGKDLPLDLTPQIGEHSTEK